LEKHLPKNKEYYSLNWNADSSVYSKCGRIKSSIKVSEEIIRMHTGQKMSK
jgi:hypothetical protein